MADDLSIPKQVIPWLIAGALGFGGGEFTDMTGARAWKETNAEELMQSAEKDRQLIALQAQNDQLLSLLSPSLCEVPE